MSRPIPVSALKHPAVFIASGFGIGCLPKAPGTFGTLLAVPMVYLMQMLEPTLYIGITLACSILGIWICDVASSVLGEHDHGGIVLDEIAGYMVTMFLLPTTWWWLLAGFVLFRFFDILKPWPISYLDRSINGGLGIMIDDIVAGLMSLAVLHLCATYLV